MPDDTIKPDAQASLDKLGERLRAAWEKHYAPRLERDLQAAQDVVLEEWQKDDLERKRQAESQPSPSRDKPTERDGPER